MSVPDGDGDHGGAPRAAWPDGKKESLLGLVTCCDVVALLGPSSVCEPQGVSNLGELYCDANMVGETTRAPSDAMWEGCTGANSSLVPSKLAIRPC